ncbi:MAG: hypothetical protein GC165_12355 [Armatimonadetes bacterium]|nr:hypothetical protein [Armatimonadota bacterium]
MGKVLSFAWLSLVLAATSFAQVRPVVSSLESKVARADAICVGTIESLSEERTEFGQGYTNFTITVKVSHVLKGNPESSISFVGYTTETYANLKQIQAKAAPVWVARILPYDPQSHPDPSWVIHTDWNELTMDYKVLSTQDAIVKRLKEYVAANPAPVKTKSIMSFVPMFISPSRGIVDFILPDCPALESLAHRMIDDPKTFVPPADEHEKQRKGLAAYDQSCQTFMRFEGLNLLSGFKSDQNIRLVQKYLSDSSVVITYRTPDEKVLWYMLRSASYQILTKWGVKVEVPIDEAPIDSVKSTDGLMIFNKLIMNIR